MPQFLERNDVLPAGLAPRQTRATLANIGGLNQYKEPIYRVVLAQHVMEWHGGEFWDWPEDYGLHDQGGLMFVDEVVKKKFKIQPRDEHGVLKDPIVVEYEGPVGMVPNERQPIRRVVESRYVEKYPHLIGWILQRWRPASHFGSRATWESYRYPGTDILMLGPYPDRGAYEHALEFVSEQNGQLVRNTWYTMPALGKLEEGIAFLEEQRIDKYGADPEVRMKIRMAERQDREIARRQKESTYRRAFIRDLIRPYCGSSLEAGRLREQLARDTGFTGGHVGN